MTHKPEVRPKRQGAWDIRTFVIDKVAPVIEEYASWYAEFGVSLPPAYELDPTGWTIVLWKINRAFELAKTIDDEDSEWAEARACENVEIREKLLADLQDEVTSGFRLFGKHLMDLFDKYGPDQAR